MSIQTTATAAKMQEKNVEMVEIKGFTGPSVTKENGTADH